MTTNSALTQELIALGVLELRDGQIVIDRGFQEILQTEMCWSGLDQKRSIANLVHLYFPYLTNEKKIDYSFFIETFILWN